MGHEVICGDALAVLRTRMPESVQMCVTSPPYYGLRDYGVEGQLGLEDTPQLYVERLVEVFREVKRVLRDDGTCWLNLGDSYAGSGKGGNPEDSPHQKQATNRGSEAFVRGKRIERGSGRWGGGNCLSGNGLKPKDLIGVPWMTAFALRTDGWYLRQDIIWAKPNPMPESVRDRCTKSHEYLFLLSKSERYYYDRAAINEPALGGLPGNVNEPKGARAYANGDEHHRTKAGLLAYSFKRRTATTPPPGTIAQHREDRQDVAYNETRNKRSVWTVSTHAYPDAHFATFPPKLIEPCILAGSAKGDTVLDPFSGSGTTGIVALGLNRNYIGIELNPEYCAMSEPRLKRASGIWAEIVSRPKDGPDTGQTDLFTALEGTPPC